MTARKVMPMNSVASRAAITASVVAAFFASGGLNAGTPVAIASVPVRATAPAANARRISRIAERLGRGLHLAGDRRAVGLALAEDDDPERTRPRS